MKLSSSSQFQQPFNRGGQQKQWTPIDGVDITTNWAQQPRQLQPATKADKVKSASSTTASAKTAAAGATDSTTSASAAQRISVSALGDIFSQYGTNGQMSRSQVASAAMDMLGQGRNKMFMVLATFLVGGKDGKGLWPGVSNTSTIGMHDIDALAQAGGASGQYITSGSFQAMFGTKAGGGRSFTSKDINTIQALANTNGATNTTDGDVDTSNAAPNWLVALRRAIANLRGA